MELHHGELRGLDFRFKTAASLFRKVMSRLDASIEASVSTQEIPPNPADILSSVMDILRYTAVFPTKEYTSSVKTTLAFLRDQGFKEVRVKNFWGPGDGYQGMNTVFVSPGMAHSHAHPGEHSHSTGEPGHAFELQFHTHESLTMKEEECHSSYEKFRTANSPHKMMQYWEEMVSMWDMVPVPHDVLSIPTVVQQTLEFDCPGPPGAFRWP